ncbi:uncharacterized protein KY384_008342 [Bacidia gigantensis]|uniref:uncharacterized protein n=1 Tax=Bacidia gigantensis TaxID=2732470 RepID=UPI001D05233D|nr:uncharacterized protein KY384_008342 [Bacidia gigantensis]KAG8526913.1 hypothetical protein KY384_008342 [Bacidia gigantensis]
MDHAAYHVIYVDTRLSQGLDGKLVQKTENALPGDSDSLGRLSWEDRNPECLKAILGEIEEVRTNLKRLLTHFNNERTCMANLRRLDSTGLDQGPTLVLSGISFEAVSEVRGNDAGEASIHPSTDPEGLCLLNRVAKEISSSKLPRTVLPVAVVHGTRQKIQRRQPFAKTVHNRPSSGGSLSATPHSSTNMSNDLTSAIHTLKCVDAGAIDVLDSPLQEERLHSLIVRAYRCHKDARDAQAGLLQRKRERKLSWLGNTENKPYAYLREKMVSDLMTGICNPEEHIHLGYQHHPPDLSNEREAQIKQAIGSWSYWGHDYSEEELIYAARFMLEHALSLPELERWRIPTERLTMFLVACRASYNDFVEYHNFRHVIDVMQATFHFLIQLGVLPSFPLSPSSSEPRQSKRGVASLLKPLEALTMLITAIGHDVGHPGVNNAFLVSLNAPLAQLYNDRSVLEAFHCAAYSQILRRHWRVAFEDTEMRNLMINSILATDMGVHQKYMTDLGNLQEKLHHQQGLDGFNAQQLEEYKTLACALLIKCADISNVARPYNVAVRWANILQLEFANQGIMEEAVGIPTALFGGPPELGNLVKLGQSQRSFMNFFAQPLFESVADVLPDMVFAVTELKQNQAEWTERIRNVTENASPHGRDREHSKALSPRSRSPIRSESQPELSHPEGLPASNPSPEPSLSTNQTQPSLPMQLRSSDPAITIPPHVLSDRSLQPESNSRRSSQTYALNTSSLGPEHTADFSRRSSGALHSAASPNVALAPRRTSNSSPSQLQLAPDTQPHPDAMDLTVENRNPNSRASEDTLSQIQIMNGVAVINTNHTGLANGSGGGGDVMRRGSKGNDQTRSQAAISYQHIDHSYEQRNHHRSSSGAHTNNTTLSQSTPYSPTGTQATSVLTVESDEKGSHGRMNSWPERNGAPDVPNVERPGSSHRVGASGSISGSMKEPEIKTSVLNNNGSLRGSNPGHRSIGKRSSKFNIFHSWKRRGNRTEASP